MSCDHDNRFHLMGATNGCCACEVEKLQNECDHLRNRNNSSDDQFSWLVKWLRERFGVDNNSVIGRDGWPKRCVEVVAKVVNEEIERLRKVITVAMKYRNVSRGFRAEDKTVELPFVDDHEIDKYEAELRLQLFRELDRLEEK